MPCTNRTALPQWALDTEPIIFEGIVVCMRRTPFLFWFWFWFGFCRTSVTLHLLQSHCTRGLQYPKQSDAPTNVFLVFFKFIIMFREWTFYWKLILGIPRTWGILYLPWQMLRIPSAITPPGSSSSQSFVVVVVVLPPHSWPFNTVSFTSLFVCSFSYFWF